MRVNGRRGMGEHALSVQSLSVQLGARQVLRGIHAPFELGRWTCIVGPNGAGKSSLLKALVGLLPSTGKIELGGLALTHWDAQRRAQHIAWLAQDETGGAALRVRDLVMLGRLPHLGLLGAVTSADQTACEQAMQATQTSGFADEPLGTLSAGQQQRVRLARALATQAPILLLDEPLANLDPPHQLECVQLIRRLVAQGSTVITVLHELPMALQSDELLILQAGELVHQGGSQLDATHRALERVFDHTIRVVQLTHAGQAHWVVVPNSTRG
ncbi:MAG: ABC transporter ATP-binding protein [Brachymonas sp.]